MIQQIFTQAELLSFLLVFVRIQYRLNHIESGEGEGTNLYVGSQNAICREQVLRE